ncbi:hypothetical protein D3C84_977530 [compost metagenome]
MAYKNMRLTILIDCTTKQKLEALSEKADLTVSQIIRKLIRDHLLSHENQAHQHPGELTKANPTLD